MGTAAAGARQGQHRHHDTTAATFLSCTRKRPTGRDTARRREAHTQRRRRRGFKKRREVHTASKRSVQGALRKSQTAAPAVAPHADCRARAASTGAAAG